MLPFDIGKKNIIDRLLLRRYTFVVLLLVALSNAVELGFLEAGGVLSAAAVKAFENARSAYKAARWNEVITNALVILQEDQNNVEAHVYLAVADLNLGRIQQAVQRLVWVNTVAPDNAAYRFLLANALKAAGQLKEAIVQADFACKLAPQNGEYRIFYDSLLSKTATASAELVASGAESSASPQSSTMLLPSKPLVKEPFENEQWMKIEAECKQKPDSTLEILLNAILKDPTLLAGREWPFLRNAVAIRQKSPRLEVIRRFLAWKSGEISDKDLEKWLPTALPRELWEKDANLAAILPALRGGGINLSFLVPSQTAQNDFGWASTLDALTLSALSKADFQEAWNTHVKNVKSTGEWHYQAARLALELWQFYGFDEEWLKVARDQLLAAQEGSRWSDEASIILKEVNKRLQ